MRNDWWTVERLIEVEDQIKKLWEAGDLPYLIHLCGGNEEQLLHIFSEIPENAWILGSHRSHYHYLLAGGEPEDLIAEVKAGRSMFLFNRGLKFLSSSIVAGTPCIAAGIALSMKRAVGHMMRPRVYCFVGDGAEDQGHFYEAVRFVAHHDLPCRFIIEDNDQSCNTPKSRRMGVHRWMDDCVIRYSYKPTYPHAGSGCSHKITFKAKPE